MISGTFYTMTETAERLGMTRETMRQWFKKGKLKGQRVGNMVLIEEKEVKRLEANRERENRI